MATFTDTNELRAYLRRITTYEAFWEAKEPSFFDPLEKAFWDEHIRLYGDPDGVLRTLKRGEIRAFAREQEERQDHRLH